MLFSYFSFELSLVWCWLSSSTWSPANFSAALTVYASTSISFPSRLFPLFCHLIAFTVQWVSQLVAFFQSFWLSNWFFFRLLCSPIQRIRPIVSTVNSISAIECFFFGQLTNCYWFLFGYLMNLILQWVFFPDYFAD